MSNKKQQKLNQATTANFHHPTEPFQNYDASVFAAMADDTADSTLPIMEIIPDHTQPRRIMSQEIRRDWDGTPQGYRKLIDTWESRVQKIAKGAFPIDILIGKASALERKTDDPLVLDFIELLGFAANIRDIGLNHPIGAVKRGDYHRLVFGERRWTAYQILNHYLGDTEDWGTIPAKILVASDWEIAKAQSAENNQNKRLNAIGRAREFAKLLMIARTDGGERYDSWNQLVNPGGCDRAWYAQVSNGELHRIPRNLGPQFVQALNISEVTMRKYRGLLRLFDNHNLSSKVNDAIWLLGDAGSWSENFMRDIEQYLSVEEVDEILNLTKGYTVPTGTVYATESALFKAVKAKKEAEEAARKAAELEQKQAEEAVTLATGQNTTSAETAATPGDSNGTLNTESTWPSHAWVGKPAYSGSVAVHVKTASMPGKVIVITEDGNEEFEVKIDSLSERSESDTSPLPKNLTARAVQTVVGAIALVQTDANGVVQLRFPDDTTTQMEKKFVSPVAMTEWWEAVARYKVSLSSGNNAGSSTTTAVTTGSTPGTSDDMDFDDEDDLEEDDDFSLPVPEVPDFEPFNQVNLELLQFIADAADLIDIEESLIIDDLCKLDRKQVQHIARTDGIAVIDGMIDAYQRNTATALEKMMQRIEAHLKGVKAIASAAVEGE